MGATVYVVVLDPWFRRVLMIAGMDQYLTEQSILEYVCKFVEPVVRCLSACLMGQASLEGSAEEDAQELEGGSVDVEGGKIPPPYPVSGIFPMALLSSRLMEPLVMLQYQSIHPNVSD